jgi:hypothetical protein
MFDPAAIEALIRAEDFDPNAWDDATDDCRMALFLPGTDGSSVVAIYVNETPREGPTPERSNVATGFLHVPSGGLCVTGAESIDHPDGATMDLVDYHPEMGERFVIDRGWYQVRAFTLETGDGPLNEKILAMMPSHERETHKRDDNACVVGCGLMLFGVMALIITFVLQFFVSAINFWWVLLTVVGVWLIYYLWIIVSPQQRAVKRAAQQYAQLARLHEGEYPDLVFELTTIDERDLPEGARGCRLER